jgi:hypothetical protein
VLNVRNMCLLAVAALALGSPGLARAQALPPNQLLGGEVQLAVGATQFGGSCYVNRGSSTFQRNGLGSKAVISFSEIVDSAIWELQGQAVLTFTTTTSGTIRFKRAAATPPAIHSPAFMNYTQTFNPVDLKLVVTFSIVFPDCTLPVFATFDTT